jgi:hypothetical protein
MKLDDFRDAILAQANEKQQQVIRARDAFLRAYCAEQGWDVNDLTLAQVMEIRQQPQWQQAAADEPLTILVR